MRPVRGYRQEAPSPLEVKSDSAGRVWLDAPGIVPNGHLRGIAVPHPKWRGPYFTGAFMQVGTELVVVDQYKFGQ
jgi:hypothetical protein